MIIFQALKTYPPRDQKGASQAPLASALPKPSSSVSAYTQVKRHGMYAQSNIRNKMNESRIDSVRKSSMLRRLLYESAWIVTQERFWFGYVGVNPNLDWHGLRSRSLWNPLLHRRIDLRTHHEHFICHSMGLGSERRSTTGALRKVSRVLAYFEQAEAADNTAV